MYTWKLLGHDTSKGPLRSGVGSELAPILRMLDEHLAEPLGFLGYVTEVVPRLSVLHLNAVHVPTGREWLGRRDSRGAVCWETRYRPVDPDGAVDLDGAVDPDSDEGPETGPCLTSRDGNDAVDRPVGRDCGSKRVTVPAVRGERPECPVSSTPAPRA